MTGFGRGEATTDGWTVAIELSGVNRKQLDLAINVPSSLIELEPAVRKRLTDAASRGRIGVKVNISATDDSGHRLQIDEGIAKQYVNAARRISESCGIETRITAADLFRAPGIFSIDDSSATPEVVGPALMSALDTALSQFIAMQEEEGSYLNSDLSNRIDNILSEVDSIAKRSETVPQTHREHLQKRLSESGLELDLNDERILREIALYAERCDITEEITRIASHAVQFRTYLSSEESVGRSLDFLCQEFNRELNTIGSKANDAEIAQRIVNSKTELEKIREQVQNVQ